jgi:hypothetical protein
LGTGNSYYQTYLNYLADYISAQGITDCNNMNVFSESCANSVNKLATFKEMMKYQLMWQYFPSIQDTEQCVQDTLLSAYFGSPYIKNN